MGTNWPKPGINHVGEYQVSGHTLAVTGSGNTIFLKYVASGITLSATSDATASFFDSSHVATLFPMKASTTATYKGKFLTFKVPANINAIVSLTNIPSSSYLIPSASQLHSARA